MSSAGALRRHALWAFRLAIGGAVHRSVFLRRPTLRNFLSREIFEQRTPFSLFPMANFSSSFDTASLYVDLLRSAYDEIKCDDHYSENYRQEEDGQSPRQSPNKKNLKEIRQGERFHLFKSRGQHLLTNLRVLDSIIQKAKILPTDTVLEIGPGTGNLTVRLLERAKKVIAVEIDERMVDTLQNRVAALGLDDKLIVITGNALKMKFPHFDLCVANIPYGISSPLIAKLFLMQSKPCFRNAFLLLQKEFAHRLLAKPGESNFNRLAVNIRLVASAYLLMNVSKKDFVPSPKVDSSLVCIQPKLNKPDVDLDEWLCFTRTCFSKKNKTLGAIFKQKRKIIELYSKLKSSHKNIKTMENEEHTSLCDVDDMSESDDCDIWPSTLELENQNFAEVVWFREKILKILKDGGFCEKRPSKLSNEDFLCLLQLFNNAGVFFH